MLPFLAAGIAAILFLGFEPIFVLCAPVYRAHVMKLDEVDSAGDDGTSTSYYVHYRYRIGSKDRDKNDQVDKSEFDQLHVEQSIQVQAISLGQLDYSLIARSRAGYISNRLAAWIVTLFYNFVILAISYAIWIEQRRQRRLIQNGTVTIGRVLSTKSWPTDSGRIYRVKYEYTTDHHVKLTAKMGVFLKSCNPSLDVGKSMLVLFSPARPNSSIVYQYSDFEVA